MMISRQTVPLRWHSSAARLLRSLLGGAAVLLLASGASGQQEPLALEINLSNPGARSMGFGGAFVALADDATAAFANPAGLVQLLRPELSAEVRLCYQPDESQDVFSDATGLGFFSLVYPHRKWSVAAYTHQLTNAEFVDFTPMSMNYDVNSYGLSAAYRLGESLSIGIGIAHYDEQGEPYLIPDYGGQVYAHDRTARAKDWGLNGGVLWRITEQWTAGGFYRQGPRLGLDIPDVFGLGGSFSPGNGAITLSFEWDHVQYSSLLADLGPLPADIGRVRINDADELHLGGEYVFLKAEPVQAIRFGLWLDPEHQVRFGDQEPESDDVHLAAGYGVAWKQLQLDAAMDVTSGQYAASFSVIYSF